MSDLTSLVCSRWIDMLSAFRENYVIKENIVIVNLVDLKELQQIHFSLEDYVWIVKNSLG
jgi:hypothetical protein